MIAECHGEERFANARLIAAAPDLLAALRQFCENIEAAGGITEDDLGVEMPCGDPEWVDMAITYRAATLAIAKAEGGE